MNDILGYWLLKCPFNSNNLYKIKNKELVLLQDNLIIKCKSFLTKAFMIKDLEQYIGFDNSIVKEEDNIEVFHNGHYILMLKLEDKLFLHNDWLSTLRK